MGRRRIWEINCFGLDAVLCTSFDADELMGLDPQFQAARGIPEHPAIELPRSLVVYGIAHKLCHSENPVSCGIERRLDTMHARILRQSSQADKVDVLAECYAAGAEARDDLPGCLWAVLTDSRDELRRQGLFWVQGLMIRSLLHWMRSPREGRDALDGSPCR